MPRFIAAAKPTFRQLHQTHGLAPHVPHRFARAVGGIVIHDDRLDAHAALGERRGHGVRQIGLVVVGNDDDGDVNHENERFVIGDW
jgi:hypothetical protein